MIRLVDGGVEELPRVELYRLLGCLLTKQQHGVHSPPSHRCKIASAADRLKVVAEAFSCVVVVVVWWDSPARRMQNAR